MNPQNRFLARTAFAALVTALAPIFLTRAIAQPPPFSPGQTFTQIVSNPGFEGGSSLPGWSCPTGATAQLTSNEHSGSCAAEVIVTTPNIGGLTQTLSPSAMTAGSWYRVSAWVRLEQNQSAALIGLHLSGTVNGIPYTPLGLVEQPIADNQDGTWHFICGSIELDPGAMAPTALQLSITSDDVVTNFDVDDVSVYPMASNGIQNASFLDEIDGSRGVMGIKAGAVRQLMNLYTFEDNWNGYLLNLNGTVTWSMANGILSQTSLYFSNSCTPPTGSVSGANYTVSVGVRFDGVTGAQDGTASIRFGVDAIGNGYTLSIQPYPTTQAPYQFVLTKTFVNSAGTETIGSQVLGSAMPPTGDPIGVGPTFHTITVTFDSADGVITVGYDTANSIISAATDAALAGGSVSLGTFRCGASFNNFLVTNPNGSQYTDSFDSMDWTPGRSPAFKQLTSVAAARVPVVFTFSTKDPRNFTVVQTGTDKKGNPIYTNYTTIPTTGSTPSFQTVEGEIKAFLAAFGQNISIFAVDNETNFDYTPSDREKSGTTYPAIVWLQSVASWAKAAIADPNNQDTLGSGRPDGGLLVASGAMVPVLNAYDSVSYRSTIPNGDFLTALVNWVNTDSNIDFIDFHAHEASELFVEQALAYLQGETTKPLICTEWSQAPADVPWLSPQELYQDNNFSNNPNFLGEAAFPPAAGVTSTSTNGAFISAAYLYPVTQKAWKDFVAASPLADDPNFLQDVANLYNRNGVVVQTYGAYDQYGSPEYDMKQIFASETVQLDPSSHMYQANPSYLSAFQALASTPVTDGDQVYPADYSSSTWSTSGGTWIPPSTASPYLQQTNESTVAYTSTNAVTPTPDVVVVEEITPTAFSTSSNAVGVMARYSVNSSHQKSYYAALYRQNTANGTLEVQKMINNVPTSLLPVITIPSLALNVAHRFEFDVQGNTLTLSVDDVPQAPYTDSSLTAAGEVGLITNDATADFAGFWTTVNGTETPSNGSYTLTPSAGDMALAYSGTWNWSNYSVEAQVSTIGTSYSTGLVAQYSGTYPNESYYALLYQTGTPGQIVLQKVLNGGTPTTLRTLPMNPDPGVAQSGGSIVFSAGLRLEVQSGMIRGYLNGRLICSEQDSSLPTGSAGIITNNTKGGTFEDVVVAELSAFQ